MKAVLLGRFQPFHEGHYKVVNHLKDNYSKVEILIGSKNTSRTLDNPLTFEERKKIIENCFPNIKITGIEDEEKDKEGNKKWVKKLEGKLDKDAKLVSGNDLVIELVQKHTEIEQQEPKSFNPEIYSGTEIRRRIRSGGEWRYLVNKCAEEELENYLELIKKTGIQYEYEPGWKKEHAFYGTEEDN